MKKTKVWFATLCLLLAFSTMVIMPTRALADPPQTTQPTPTTAGQTIDWAAIIAAIRAALSW